MLLSETNASITYVVVGDFIGDISLFIKFVVGELLLFVIFFFKTAHGCLAWILLKECNLVRYYDTQIFARM